jgi:hypothetical protein
MSKIAVSLLQGRGSQGVGQRFSCDSHAVKLRFSYVGPQGFTA